MKIARKFILIAPPINKPIGDFYKDWIEAGKASPPPKWEAYDAGGMYEDGTPCEWSSANCVPLSCKLGMTHG